MAKIYLGTIKKAMGKHTVLFCHNVSVHTVYAFYDRIIKMSRNTYTSIRQRTKDSSKTKKKTTDKHIPVNL